MSDYDRLGRKMASAGYDEKRIYSVILLLEDLNQRKVANVGKLERNLTDSVRDHSQFSDYQTEGKAALILAHNDFDVTLYPFGKKGADFTIVCGDHSVAIEFARFREDYETTRKLEEAAKGDTLVRYGRGEKDIEGVYGKITEEVAQLPCDEVGLVMVKSDNDRIEEVEFRQAVKYLEDAVTRDPALYTRLSAILFFSNWLYNGSLFFLWQNPKAAKQLDEVTAIKLRQLALPPRHLPAELETLRLKWPIPSE